MFVSRIAFIFTAFLVQHSTCITNRHSARSFRHISSYQPPNPLQINWELGLRESVIQALIREQFADPNIRKHILNAPLLGKQDKVTPFGDIAILARGQLFLERSGYIFVQDPYENDCDDCHTVKNRCGHLQCEVWKPKHDEQLVALWSVKRIRHRHDEDNPNYEIEYTISPIHLAIHHGIFARNGRFNYAIPGHVFVIRTEHSNHKTPVDDSNHHRYHKIVIGEGPNGYKQILQSYPSFFTTTGQPWQTPKPTANIYQELINALNKKTTEQTNSATKTTSVATELPKTTLVQLPTGDIIPIHSLTTPFISKTTPGYVSVRFPTTTPEQTTTTTSRTPVKTTFHFFSAAEEENEPVQPSTKQTTYPIVTEPQTTTFLLPQIPTEVAGEFTGVFEGFPTQPMQISTQYSSESTKSEAKTTPIQLTTPKTTKITRRYTSSLRPSTTVLVQSTTTLQPTTTKRYTTNTVKETTTKIPSTVSATTEAATSIKITPYYPDTTFRTTQHLTETTQFKGTTSPMTVKEFAVTSNSKTTPKRILTTIKADGTVTVQTTPIFGSTTREKTTLDNTGFESTAVISKTTLGDVKSTTTVENTKTMTTNFKTTVPTISTTIFNTVTASNNVETTRLKTTRLRPITSTASTFLTDEVVESKEPQYTKPVLKDVSNDDIFGGTRLTTKSVQTTSRKYVPSDLEKDLFGERKSKSLKTFPKVIYSDFYEASTEAATMGTLGTTTGNNQPSTTPVDAVDTTQTTVKIQPVTRQSYSTSISFEVNKRNKSTNMPDVTTEAISTERVETKRDTKEIFDDLALRLINHAKTIDILSENRTTTKRPKYKRRKYVSRVKRPVKKLKKVIETKQES